MKLYQQKLVDTGYRYVEMSFILDEDMEYISNNLYSLALSIYISNQDSSDLYNLDFNVSRDVGAEYISIGMQNKLDELI